MSDYEKEQAKLLALWEEFKDDEEEFPDYENDDDRLLKCQQLHLIWYSCRCIQK